MTLTGVTGNDPQATDVSTHWGLAKLHVVAGSLRFEAFTADDAVSNDLSDLGYNLIQGFDEARYQQLCNTIADAPLLLAAVFRLPEGFNAGDISSALNTLIVDPAELVPVTQPTDAYLLRPADLSRLRQGGMERTRDDQQRGGEWPDDPSLTAERLRSAKFSPATLRAIADEARSLLDQARNELELLVGTLPNAKFSAAEAQLMAEEISRRCEELGCVLIRSDGEAFRLSGGTKSTWEIIPLDPSTPVQRHSRFPAGVRLTDLVRRSEPPSHRGSPERDLTNPPSQVMEVQEAKDFLLAVGRWEGLPASKPSVVRVQAALQALADAPFNDREELLGLVRSLQVLSKHGFIFELDVNRANYSAGERLTFTSEPPSEGRSRGRMHGCTVGDSRGPLKATSFIPLRVAPPADQAAPENQVDE